MSLIKQFPVSYLSGDAWKRSRLLKLEIEVVLIICDLATVDVICAIILSASKNTKQYAEK